MKNCGYIINTKKIFNLFSCFETGPEPVFEGREAQTPLSKGKFQIGKSTFDQQGDSSKLFGPSAYSSHNPGKANSFFYFLLESMMLFEECYFVEFN